MEEIWKDIVGYEGRYQVSNMGRVRSLTRLINNPVGMRRSFGRILKPQKSGNGYLFVNLMTNCKKKGRFIQTLVAEAFIPNPNNYPIVNHKSEDKHDNRAENLEWCTYSYNNHYGSLAEKLERRKRPVLQYTKNGVFVKKYSSLTDAAKTNGFLIGNIASCCRRRIQSAYGFIWKYE